MAPDGGDDQSAGPTPADPSGAPPPGGGQLPPQGGAGSQQIAQVGQQAMARAKLKLMVHVLHTDIFPSFELNSDEGKAVQKALNALAPFAGGGKDDADKNGAMATLMQRAMQAKMGGQPGQPGGQTPSPKPGPIPTAQG